MGSTPFEMRSCEIELDEGCGMGFSAVHAIRAEACAALEAAVLAPYDKRTRALADVRLTSLSPAAPAARRATDPEMCAIAVTLDAARAAREAGASRIYMTVDDLTAEGMSPESAMREHIIPVLDEVSRERDHARLDPWISAGAPVAVGTISELSLAAERGAATELRSCIPAHNAACLAFLANAGAHAAWLSPELSLTEIERLAPQSPITLGITVFGKPRVMTSEHCILQVADACIHDCERCSLRRRKLVLHNIDDKLLPVRTDLHGRSHLFDAYALDYTPQLPQLLAAGITRFMVDGTLLESEELAAQVARAHRALDAALAGKRPSPRQKATSSGCLFAEVE